MTLENKRARVRIETDILCVVDGTTEGRIRNLALGSALLLAPAGIAAIRETVSLKFHVGDVAPVAVLGEVLRVSSQESEAAYGIQFVAVEPADGIRLARCLDLLLAGKGVGRRQAPRLFRRVELRCHAAAEFYATMDNICRGGMGLDCEVALEVGEEVAVEVLVGSLDAPFKVRGQVVHARLAEGGLHRVGLQFGALTPAQRENLDEMLQTVLR